MQIINLQCNAVFFPQFIQAYQYSLRPRAEFLPHQTKYNSMSLSFTAGTKYSIVLCLKSYYADE